MCRPVINRIVGDLRYQVSNEFKQECMKNLQHYKKVGKLHIVEDNADITESDNLVEFKIEDNAYVDGNFIGTVVARKITAKILNPNSLINLEDKEISVSTGIVIDGKKEEVPFGNFIIDKPENEELREKTDFVGYDYMIKFNATYQDRVTYPCEAKVLFQDVCNQVGLQAGNIDFINCDYIIKGNPFTGENQVDCRTVLSKIAELAGGFAHIGRDNKVYIVTPKNVLNLLRVKDVHNMAVNALNDTKVKLIRGNKDTKVKDIHTMPVRRLTLRQLKYLTGTNKNSIDYELAKNNYLDNFIKNNTWGEINSITATLSNVEGEYTTIQDEESISKYGLTEIVITDNPYLSTQEDREQVVTALWKYYKGFRYLPFKVDYYGYPYTDCGDVIYVYDTKDNRYTSWILNHTFIYNGAYSGSIETQALTKTQAKYKNTMNIKSRFRKVELSVDKMNGRITSEVSRIDDELAETSSRIEQTDTEIRAEVSKKVGNDEIISKINQSAEQIQINAGKISLER